MNSSDSRSKSGKRWAVVGGGFLGMTAALRLAQAGHQVTLIESADHLGGLADAWELGGTTWDRHYHVTLLSDSNTRGILKELDLDQAMEWVETKTGFFTGGSLHSMSSSLEFLLFPPLNLIAKFRLGLTIFAAARMKNWRRLEQMPVSDFLRKWSGKQTFEKIWLPLLRSKLGENYKITSAAFIWATIQRLYAARRTGLKKEMFGYLPGGYARTIDKFTEKLNGLDVNIQLSQRVGNISRVGNETLVADDADQPIGSFDNVLLTVPSRIVPRLVKDLSAAEIKSHQSIQYQGIVCCSLLLKNPLSSYYVTNITDGNVPFTGVIEMTALVDRAEFGGSNLVYLPYYVPENDPLFEVSNEEIREQSLAGIESMYPQFQREDVLAFRSSRVKQVMPIPTLNYSQQVPGRKTSIPGLFVVNSAQIVNGTLNVNETIGLAETAVREILQDPQTDSQPDAPTLEKPHVAAR